MSPRVRSGRLAAHAGQHGAISVFAAGTLALALVLTLLVVDSGRLYLEKRRLQSIADASALEAANRGGQCATNTSATDYAIQSATRNGFTVVPGDTSRGLAVTCGFLVTPANNLRVFSADATRSEAIRVVVTRTVTTSIANGMWSFFEGAAKPLQTTLSATAVAALAPPLAQLTIRSTLGTLNASKSDLLNKLVGGFLGGSLNISIAGWQGLTSTNLNLLSFLDKLAIEASVTAGDYTTLLNTLVSPTQLMNAALTVLQQNGAVTAVTLQAVSSIQLIAGNTKLVKLGDLLNITSGTPNAALNTDIQLFTLIQGMAQVANNKSLASAQFQFNIPLVGNATVTTRVIEPPQISLAGNPYLAKAGLATGTHQIYVRTAQVRTLVSIDAPVLKTVSQLASVMTGLAVPVAGVVNNLLHLNLAGVVSNVLCLISCESTDVEINTRLDISLDAASASSRVTDFSCTNDLTKSLTVEAKTSLATLSIGSINPAAAFASSTPTAAQPIRLIDIGSRHCVGVVVCGARTANVGGGLMLSANSTLAAKTDTLTYKPVADMKLAPTYQTFPNGEADIISSLGKTLSGLQVSYVPPTGTVSNTALAGVANLLASITTALADGIKNLLTPVLDPVINTLLASLGINLGSAEIGANLSCHMGSAYLVI